MHYAPQQYLTPPSSLPQRAGMADRPSPRSWTRRCCQGFLNALRPPPAAAAALSGIQTSGRLNDEFLRIYPN
ncbi:hypothetical protein CKAH01_10222 [Colletotrichum kahawae]|uniref:Uncharacterized protein n=1 Tax=Colletotrichum kahawae TaxID=34407 RepID=A0AAE0CZ43_COLKA|nr:hypothetical protein CKAH01_10222 [Colletotrichum kahawae]